MFHQQKNVFTSLSHNGFGSSIAFLFSHLLMVGVESKKNVFTKETLCCWQRQVQVKSLHTLITINILYKKRLSTKIF